MYVLGDPVQRTVSSARAEFVRWIQSALNQVAGAGLVVDGIMGPETRTAVKSFQLQAGTKPDGVVGPTTRGLLLAKSLAPTGTVPRGFPCSHSEVIAQFEKGKSHVEPSTEGRYRRFIERIAQCVSDTQGTSAKIEVVEIEGHASLEGDKTLNFNLGKVRALRVAQDLAAALVARGHPVEVDPVAHRPPAIAIVTRTRGASRPRASNQTEAGRKVNRRVEVLLPIVATSGSPCPAPCKGSFVTILIDLINDIGKGLPARVAPMLGGRLPTTVRQLCEDEAKEAYKVFSGSLDLTKIFISDGVGGNKRPVTTAVEHPDGWHVVLNMGDTSNWATTAGRRCNLIHELVHAWQSQHHATDKQAYMWNAAKCQALALKPDGSSPGAYAYVKRRDFEKYSAEQIAQQVQEDYMGVLAAPKIMPIIRRPKPNEPVPENEESLKQVKFHLKGAPGVKWPTFCPK